MFNIKGRQTPLFSLNQLKEVSFLAEKIFKYESIICKNLSAFDLLSTVRINEINSKTFQSDEKNFDINVDNYTRSFENKDFIYSVKDCYEYYFKKKVKFIDCKNPKEKEFFKCEDTIIVDFQKLDKLPLNFPSGDYLSIFQKGDIPSEIESFIGFSADIKIQTGLDNFEKIHIPFDKIIGYIKI